MTGDSKTSARPELDTDAVAAFAAALRGQLVQPGDADYETARRVHNGMIDRRPALIARCADVADVIAGVNFARDNGLLLAVRGGGHNGPGLGTCDDGLVLDLVGLKGIRVDPAARTARVEGGCTLGEMDHATHAFGLAAPSGVNSTTGVGGLTLGGGMGHLTRKYGLAIDNLLEVDIVLADGSFVTASEEQHPDLFWAIRGGGGNFGVVTSFLFRLHPVATVYAGPMLWQLDVAEDVLNWYGEFMPSAPDELIGTQLFISVPPGPPFPEALWNQTMLAVAWCYCGPLEQAEDIFLPIRTRFGAPALDWVGPMPFPALQAMFDAVFPAGIQMYWKADFVNELSEESNRLRVQQALRKPVGSSVIGFHPIDGAASRVAGDATPWAYRDATYAEVMVGATHDPAENDAIIAWARETWDALHPFSAGGGYVNFMMEEGVDRIRATYRGNYDRLARIKAT
ncbi:MAG: FAD-binding oxidoreductase, partial [Vicinamibacterales bacterium]